MSSSKLALQRLMQYVFDRDAIEARDALHETMVEMIFSGKNGPLTVNTVMHEIEQQLGITIEASLVNEVVTKLVQAGAVKETSQTGQFSLNVSRKKELLEVAKERRISLERLEKEFLSIYRKVLGKPSSEKENAALEYFYSFCMKLFSSNSELLLGFLQCTGQDYDRIKNYESPVKLTNEFLNKIQDVEVREGLRKTFAKVFSDERIIKFLTIIARNYLYFQILNLDPECKSLQRDIFSQKTILLDTNFIMSLLLPSRANHTAAVKCINFSRRLGIQFRFTKRTQREFMEQLGQSQERLNKLGVRRLDVLAALDDDFIADYAVEVRKGRHKNWANYSTQFRILRETLSKYDITEYSDIEADFVVAATGLVRAIADSAIKCALKWNNRKSDTVAEHDAYHLLLVRKLREKDAAPSAVGPRKWFLTFDQSLLCVDKDINEILGLEKELPSSIECWAWLDILSPFLGGTVSKDTAHEAFAYLMRSNFRILPSKIHLQKLVDIQEANIELDEYSAKEIEAIANDEFVSRYWSDIGKAKWSTSKNAEKKAREKFDKRVEEVAAEVKERRRSKVEYVARFSSLAVAILMIVIAVSSYLARDSIAGAIVFLLFGSLFMAMAIGYAKIEILLRELQLRLKSQ